MFYEPETGCPAGDVPREMVREAPVELRHSTGQRHRVSPLSRDAQIARSGAILRTVAAYRTAAAVIPIIDMLTMYPEAQQRVVRLVGEIGATATFLILALSILC